MAFAPRASAARGSPCRKTDWQLQRILQDRADAGLTLFRPKRGATITGNNTGFGSADGIYDGNGTSNFFIPELGLIKHLDKVTTGVTVYGNGGMNTNYSKNPYAAFGNTGSAGINLDAASGEISAAYTLGLGFKKAVSGAIPAAFGGGNSCISLEEDILGVAYSWKL